MRRALALCLLALAGCSGSEPGPQLSLALNWKPEPEFGGIFEAERLGAFAERGLTVERTGGPGAPVVQMVTAKQVHFGIASAAMESLSWVLGDMFMSIFTSTKRSEISFY